MPTWASREAPCPHVVHVMEGEPQVTFQVVFMPEEPRYVGCKMTLSPEEFGEKYERDDTRTP
jgi:hypothetical protein